MAYTMTPYLRAKYNEYVKDAADSPGNLEFLLDNLGHPIECDYSVKSMEEAELAFWECVSKGLPDDLSDLSHFSNLLGQYLGECIISHTGAKWVQSKNKNMTFGQPCVDDFGGKPWDRVFPVELAKHILDIPKSKPHFPGIRERRVLASTLERVLLIHAKSGS
jgi:hypothetical protein